MNPQNKVFFDKNMALEDVTVFAVPCNQAVVLSKEEGDRIRQEIEFKRQSKEPREHLIKIPKPSFYGKPSKSNG